MFVLIISWLFLQPTLDALQKFSMLMKNSPSAIQKSSEHLQILDAFLNVSVGQCLLVSFSNSWFFWENLLIISRMSVHFHVFQEFISPFKKSSWWVETWEGVWMAVSLQAKILAPLLEQNCTWNSEGEVSY